MVLRALLLQGVLGFETLSRGKADVMTEGAMWRELAPPAQTDPLIREAVILPDGAHAPAPGTVSFAQLEDAADGSKADELGEAEVQFDDSQNFDDNSTIDDELKAQAALLEQHARERRKAGAGEGASQALGYQLLGPRDREEQVERELYSLCDGYVCPYSADFWCKLRFDEVIEADGAELKFKDGEVSKEVAELAPGIGVKIIGPDYDADHGEASEYEADQKAQVISLEGMKDDDGTEYFQVMLISTIYMFIPVQLFDGVIVKMHDGAITDLGGFGRNKIFLEDAQGEETMLAVGDALIADEDTLYAKAVEGEAEIRLTSVVQSHCLNADKTCKNHCMNKKGECMNKVKVQSFNGEEAWFQASSLKIEVPFQGFWFELTMEWKGSMNDKDVAAVVLDGLKHAGVGIITVTVDISTSVPTTSGQVKAASFDQITVKSATIGDKVMEGFELQDTDIFINENREPLGSLHAGEDIELRIERVKNQPRDSALPVFIDSIEEKIIKVTFGLEYNIEPIEEGPRSIFTPKHGGEVGPVQMRVKRKGT